MRRISVGNRITDVTSKRGTPVAATNVGSAPTSHRTKHHAHDMGNGVYVMPSNSVVRDNHSKKGRTQRKAERARERNIRKGRHSPDASRRLEEMRRLAYGCSITPLTANRRAFSGTLLPIADRDTIRRNKRLSNALPHLSLIICVSVLVACMSVLVAHMFDLSKSDGDLREVAKTYATTQPSDDDTDLPPSVDFASLQSVNPEVSGWICIPGTNVNYPILSSTEKEKYLRRDLWGNRSVAGSVFTDWRNAPDYSDEHMVLYGHHLPSDTMFTPVSNYLTDKGFYERHRTIYVETPEYTYTLKVIGVYKVLPTETNEVSVDFPSDSEFQRLVDEKLGRTKVGGTSSDDYDRREIGKLFTLVTCADNGTARSVVECVPVSRYPTSYVQDIRRKAGAKTATVSESDESTEVNGGTDANAVKARDEMPWQGVVGWLEDIVYRLATEERTA